MSTRCLIGLLAALLGAGPALAQPGLQHALIIGVSTYADPQVPALLGVPADLQSARRMALAMGIPAAAITELRDATATKRNIVARLQALAGQTGEGARVLLYFSGHGTRWQDPAAGGCVEGLLTYDGQAIVNREFAALAQPISAKADKLLIMFDACHSGGVGTLRALPRGDDGRPRPKFFVKGDESPGSCSRPVNMRTRSLLGVVGEGPEALPHNVVQITSSRPDEVSFDEAGKGGLATQGVRDCMLGKARDLDGSGAVTLDEIEVCAQTFVREHLQAWPELLPHHVSVRGLRNLIPVPAAVPPPAAAPAAEISAEAARLERERLQREQAERLAQERAQQQQLAAQRAEQLRLAEQQAQAQAEQLAALARLEREAAEQAQREQQAREQSLREQAAREQAAHEQAARDQAQREQMAGEQARREQAARELAAQERAQREQAIREQAAAAAQQPAVAAPVAAVAALRNLYDQRDPRRTVTATPVRDRLRVGVDAFELSVSSSHDGYLYIVLLGSDETSFYLLFPNGLDRQNRIKAGVPLRLPRPGWQVQAAGPAGTDRLLVMVTEQPRDLAALSLAPATAAEPFTFTAASASGRSRLIDFMIGRGVRQGSPRFGADWLQIEELP